MRGAELAARASWVTRSSVRFVFLIDLLQSGEQHLGRMTVQGAGGLIRQQELGPVDDGARAGAPLLLAAGKLVGVFVQNVRDIQLPGDVLHPGPLSFGGTLLMERASPIFSDTVSASSRL